MFEYIKWPRKKKTTALFSKVQELKNKTQKIFHRPQFSFKTLFIIENIILLTVILGILIYEYYLIDRSATSLTTQNKLTAVSMVINFLMAIF